MEFYVEAYEGGKFQIGANVVAEDNAAAVEAFKGKFPNISAICESFFAVEVNER